MFIGSTPIFPFPGLELEELLRVELEQQDLTDVQAPNPEQWVGANCSLLRTKTRGEDGDVEELIHTVQGLVVPMK